MMIVWNWSSPKVPGRFGRTSIFSFEYKSSLTRLASLCWFNGKKETFAQVKK